MSACLCGARVLADSGLVLDSEVSTGVVSVFLEMLGPDENGDLKEITEQAGILPGAQITRVARIVNAGAACYVRAMVTLPENAEVIPSILPGWVLKEDGYYYRKEPLPEGGTADLFDRLDFPDFSASAETGLTVTVRAEAVQAKEFYPDLSSDSPWGDVMILKAQESGPVTGGNNTSDSLMILFDEKQGLVRSGRETIFPEDLVLYPGESYADQIILQNSSRQPVSLWFHSETGTGLLSDAVKLTIRMKGPSEDLLLYEGPLSAQALKTPLLLPELPAGQSAQLDYQIQLSSSYDNGLALKQADVRWVFRAEMDRIVDTGAGEDPELYRAGLFFSLAGLAAVFVFQRKKTQEPPDSL